MATTTENNVKRVSTPFTLEQLAVSLQQLSVRDFELLEELLDKKFQKTILSRGKSAQKKGQAVSLQELQKEFG